MKRILLFLVTNIAVMVVLMLGSGSFCRLGVSAAGGLIVRAPG